MAHLDFKVTCWKRLRVPDEKIEEVIQRLKESDCDDVYDLQDIEGVYFISDGPDAECEEAMIPHENGGSATQELYNAAGDIIYHNSENEDEY
jgi:hypothetical protein